ncbi:MAG: cupin domain-containing protein [Bacteroidota bacterium]
MKTTFALFVASTLLGGVNLASAQDRVKLSPQMFKVLLENEHVRVYEFRAKAGEKEPMHSHPAMVVYTLSGDYRIKLTTPDGKSEEDQVNVGTALWVDAVTHIYENLGPGDAHELIIEMKAPTATKKTPAKKEVKK